MQKPLEGGLGRWGQGLSPKCLGFAAMRGGVPSQAAEWQPPPYPQPLCPGGLGCSRTLGTWPWRMLGAGS